MCVSVGGREKGERVHGNSVLSAQSLCQPKTKKKSVIFKNNILLAIKYTIIIFKDFYIISLKSHDF